MSFAKLDSNFAGSSLLAQGGLELAGFWAVLLSKKDAAGEIHDSLPKLAHDCYTTKGRVRELLDILAAPDPDSRTPDHDGRRVEIVREPRWCIRILNHERYREKDPTAAERMRRYRSRKAGVTGVTPVTPVPSASASVSVSGSGSVEGKGSGEREDVLRPQLPPEQRAEEATKGTIRGLQLKLGGMLTTLAEHPNSRIMVPDWCRKVTSYESKRNGGGAEARMVRGVADYRMISSIDRLERSIEDAQWWLEELEAGKVVSDAR